MSDFKQSAIDAILEDLDFDSVKELRAYVAKNKQDDYFYGGILYAINAVQDLSSAQPKSEERTAESAQNVPNDELISKKAEIEALIKEFKRSPIELLPSAQPEIIRCKDCKHAKITADGKYMKYCSQWDVDDALYLDSGFFCGHAERRTDDLQ